MVSELRHTGTLRRSHRWCFSLFCAFLVLCFSSLLTFFAFSAELVSELGDSEGEVEYRGLRIHSQPRAGGEGGPLYPERNELVVWILLTFVKRSVVCEPVIHNKSFYVINPTQDYTYQLYWRCKSLLFCPEREGCYRLQSPWSEVWLSRPGGTESPAPPGTPRYWHCSVTEES